MLKCLPAGGCHVRRGTAVITGGPRLRQDIYHHPEDPVSDPGTPDHPGEASGDHLYQRSGSIHEAALCADISTGSAYRQFWNISFCFFSDHQIFFKIPKLFHYDRTTKITDIKTAFKREKAGLCADVFFL